MSMDDIAHYKQTRRTRKKKVDSHKRFIDHQIELMEEDGVINAQAIFNKVIRLGYSGSDRTLRRYVNHRIHKLKSIHWTMKRCVYMSAGLAKTNGFGFALIIKNPSRSRLMN